MSQRTGAGPAGRQPSEPAGRQNSLTRGNAAIAYCRSEGQSEGQSEGRGPEVVFLGGFKSDMNGTKATALEAWAGRRGRPFTRFDYQGHGASSGRFDEGAIGVWLEDALAVIDQVTDGPLILVGSSMGAWIMIRVALARRARIAGLVGVAAAPDFTEDLIWGRLEPAARRTLMADGVWHRPSSYGDGPYPITRLLIEEARRHLVLRAPIDLDCPVRLLHGMADADVPWQTSLRLGERLTGADVRLTLVKDGDHRMSREPDIALLCRTVEGFLEE